MVSKHIPIKVEIILVSFLFMGLLCIGIYKAPLGFNYMDEPFYITIPKRMVESGDAYIYDEYHFSQLSSILLQPIYHLLKWLFGYQLESGIVLIYRYIYLFFSILSSVVLYLKIRKYGVLPSLFGTLLYGLYVPYNIMALSYNTIGIMSLLISCVIILNHKNNLEIIISGFLFACSVICCPYNIIIYILIAIIAIIPLKIFQNIRQLNKLEFVFFTIGCLTLAIPIIIFILSNSSIENIVSSIPLILSTPDHSYVSEGFIYKILHYFFCILTSNATSVIASAILVIVLICWIINFKIKKPIKKYLWLAVLFATILYLIGFFFEQYINFFAFPICIIGFFSYLFGCKRDDSNRIFWCMWIPGVVYSICIFYSSNMKFYAISSVGIIPAVSSILLVHYSFVNDNAFELMSDKYYKKSIVLNSTAVCLAIVLSISGVFLCRIRDNFWDSSTTELNCTISDGPGSGITTSENNYKSYYQVYNSTEFIRNQKQGRVLYYTKVTWPYLCDSKKVGCYSTQITRDLEFLYSYYQTHSDMIPKYIYLGKEMLIDSDEFLDLLHLNGSIMEEVSGYSIIVQ